MVVRPGGIPVSPQAHGARFASICHCIDRDGLRFVRLCKPSFTLRLSFIHRVLPKVAPAVCDHFTASYGPFMRCLLVGHNVARLK